MKYQSTRGGSSGHTFQEAIFKGYAPDGGMYMPEEIPQLSQETISSWADMPYKEIMKQIVKLFAEDEIPVSDISELVELSFQSFDDPSSPIVTKDLNGDVVLLELFNSRTLAFKDLSMCCTAQILNYFLKKDNSHAIFLSVTSGDTGSSSLQAISAVDCADAIVAFPKGIISPIQELQMITVTSDNCHVLRVEANSDDLDNIVKKFFKEHPDLIERCRIGTMNSLNWCRVMLQTAHHFYAYFQGKKLNSEKETAVFIPTGGLGNAVSAAVARHMGLPIQVVCSVTNDALTRAFYENDHSVGPLHLSLAPAMNIQIPYNWERLLYLVSDKDTETIRAQLDDYEVKGKATTKPELLKKLQDFIEIQLISDKEILATIKKCHDENDGYIVCPHTATAVAAAYRYGKSDQYNRVVLGVASPAKFRDAVEKADVPYEGRDLYTELKDKPIKVSDITAEDDACEILKDIVLSIEKKTTQNL